MPIGILSIRIYLQSHMNSIVKLPCHKAKTMTKRDFWCSGLSKIQLFLKKFSPANSRLLHVSLVLKILISSLVVRKMEPFRFMISEKRATHQLLRIDNLWISIPTLCGTFNGYPKARVEKDRHWFQSALMAESHNGQWKRVLNATISCSWEDCLRTTRNKMSIIWTSDSQVVFHSNS